MSLALRQILVICEGNHCRSPMAEALLQKALGPDFSVTSAGLNALEDHPAHEEALKLMEAAGLNISRHTGRQLTPAIALGADLILVMDEGQKADCERLHSSVRGRVFLLGHWLPPRERNIQDPIQRGPEVHRQAYDHIQRAIPLWVERLRAP